VNSYQVEHLPEAWACAAMPSARLIAQAAKVGLFAPARGPADAIENRLCAWLSVCGLSASQHQGQLAPSSHERLRLKRGAALWRRCRHLDVREGAAGIAS
jgi:hypothetical protein